MTVNELIKQLEDIRDTWCGDVPVTFDGPTFGNVELLIPYSEEGGPITDPEDQLTGVQLTTIF